MPGQQSYQSVGESGHDPEADIVDETAELLEEQHQSITASRRRSFRTSMMVLLLGVGLMGGIVMTLRSARAATEEEPILSARKGHKRLVSKKTSAPLGCHADVMIIRHCERGNIRHDCTPEGFQRAEFLTTLFGDEDERWPAPVELYARPPEPKKFVMREIELLEPLSQKLNIPIQSEGYDIAHKRDLVNKVFTELRDGELCGKLVLISWKHENIPKLARQFGCGPSQGCPEKYPDWEYDLAWNIRYHYDQPQYTSSKSEKIGGPDWTISGSLHHEGFDIVHEDKVAKQTAGSA